jgi:hypothetical protein
MVKKEIDSFLPKLFQHVPHPPHIRIVPDDFDLRFDLGEFGEVVGREFDGVVIDRVLTVKCRREASMLDSDHGGGDHGCSASSGAGEAPIAIPADVITGRDHYSVIENKSTGIKTIVERTVEQGEDGKPRPVLKITTRPMTDQPKNSN